MRKNTLILLLTTCLSFNCFGQNLQDLLKSSKQLGLISYLTTVKSLAEFKMISLTSNDQYKTELEKVQQFQSEYNLLKLAIDKFLNQLSADMIVKNRLREYKKINQYIQGYINEIPDKFLPYKDLIIEIDGRLESFMLKTYLKTLAGPSIEEVTGIAELTHGLITDARDFREKKVSNLITLLKELKLKPLKELIEKKDI